MHIDMTAVNWLAVVCAGLAAFVISGVWYTALFGNLWKSLHRYTDEQLKAIQAMRPPPIFFGGMVLGYMVLAVVVGMLVAAFDIHGWQGGLTLGLLLWAGPAAAVGFTVWMASGKHIGIFLIDAGCQLVYLPAVCVLLAMWR